MAETQLEQGRTVHDTEASPAPPLVMTSFGLSEAGRVRPKNEDQFVIADLHKAMRVRQSSLAQPPVQYGDEPAHLFLVADGMGGHEAGELASALAVEVVEQFALNRFAWFDPDAAHPRAAAGLPEAIQEADLRLSRESRAHPELHGMGTTVTLAYVYGRRLYVMHAGDSRCYLARDGAIHRLTSDHTYVAEMVRRGVLSPDEATRHRMRHVVLNVVGGGTRGVDVEVHRAEVHAGDVLLLCSDGLTEMLPDAQIAQVLAAQPQPEAAVRRLVAAANDAGGRDNITVIVARFDEKV